MLITVDIGNSTINIGYFLDSELLILKIPTHPLRPAEEYSRLILDFLAQNHIEKFFFNCIISSVVTSHTQVFKDALEKMPGWKANELLVLSHEMDTGLDIKLKAPEELGTDRLANAAGAYALYSGPVAVIDFGTATTITVVGINRDLLGGAIMPGVGLMNDTLARRTSRLSKVRLEQPAPALGTDTAGCIRSGLLLGTAGAVERILDEIETETGHKFRLVITGGQARLIGPFLKRLHEINPFLTHEGLKRIYATNRHA